MDEKLKEANAEVDRLFQDMTSLEMTLDRKDDLIAELRAEVERLERQNADPIQPSLQAENDALRAEVASLHEANRVLRRIKSVETIAALRAEVERLTETWTEAEDENTRLRDALHVARAALAKDKA